MTDAGSGSAIAVFLGYTGLVFAIAWWSHRVLAGRKFLSEYFLGSRGLGFLALALTFGATSASAGSFTGFPALIYTFGWVLALWIASYMIFPLCGMGLFGKRINQVARRAGAITIPDLLRARFQSLSLAILATLLLIFLLSFYLIPQFKAGSLIFERLLGGTAVYQYGATGVSRLVGGIPFFAEVDPRYLLGLLVFAALVVVYTTYGGFRADVWTDMLQGGVMLVGVLIMLVLALWKVGGLSRATEKMAEMTPPQLGTVVFHRTPSTASGEVIVVEADTFFTLRDAMDNLRLFRTNENATLTGAETGLIKVVEITTPGEIERVVTQLSSHGVADLPNGVDVRLGEMKSYVYGAGQTGHYVTAPGPSADSPDGFLPIGLAISFFVYWAISGTGQPGNMLRLMAFDSSRSLMRAIAALSIYFTLIYLPLVVIFCCARVLEPGLEHVPDRIMPMMAVSLTGGAGMPWLAGLILAAPFAAAMSTVDSFMLMISSAVVRDLYQRNINPQASERTIKRLSYACTLAVGAIAMLGAVHSGRFLQEIIVFAGGALSVAFLVPMAFALYWPRANAAGAIAAMVGGLGVFLAMQLAGWTPLGLDRLIWGFLASLVAGVAVTLATPGPPEHLVRRYYCTESETRHAV
jgi:Na+/pantothenate symporter